MNAENVADCYAVLSLKDRELSAEARYFLIRVLFLYGRSSEVNVTVRDLEKQTAMTNVVIKKARELLLKKNYLVSLKDHERTSQSFRRGRPRERFRLSDALINDLNKLKTEQKNWFHKERVAKLLFWVLQKKASSYSVVKPGFRKNIDEQLRPATRVVLAALYSHADACGAVRDIGLSKLGALTGMSPDRIDSHLNVLAESGYILSRITGVTGRFLFGRSTGSFFLNVFDENEASQDSAVLVLKYNNTFDHYTMHYWGARIFLDSNEDCFFDYSIEKNTDTTEQDDVSLDILKNSLHVIRTNFATQKVLQRIRRYDDRSLINELSDLSMKIIISESIFEWAKAFHVFKFRKLFKDKPRLRFALFLQDKIHGYASILLSLYWENLGFSPIKIPEQLIEQIKNDIYPERLWRNEDDKERYSLIAEALGLFIYRISLEVALFAKSIVLVAFEGKERYLLDKLNTSTYAILPVKAGWGHANNMAVAIKLSDVFVKKSCLLINVVDLVGSSKVIMEKQEFSHISDISRDILARFGLIAL